MNCLATRKVSLAMVKWKRELVIPYFPIVNQCIKY